MKDAILAFTGPHRFLSNYYPSVVAYEGQLYPTAENAFQAAKTLDSALRERFTRFTPSDAKHVGRSIPLRAGWDDMRIAVMEEVLRSKFDHTVRRSLLEATGDAALVEGNTWGDTFWGRCNGVGENNLGKLLMKIRAELLCGRMS